VITHERHVADRAGRIIELSDGRIVGDEHPLLAGAAS
jgi:hypothetical protein